MCFPPPHQQWSCCGCLASRTQSSLHTAHSESCSALCLPFDHRVQSEQPLIFAHLEDLITTLESSPDSSTIGTIGYWNIYAESPWDSGKMGTELCCASAPLLDSYNAFFLSKRWHDEFTKPRRTHRAPCENVHCVYTDEVFLGNSERMKHPHKTMQVLRVNKLISVKLKGIYLGQCSSHLKFLQTFTYNVSTDVFDLKTST